VNLAHCGDGNAANGCLSFPKEPDLLRTGIYFGDHADRPAAAKGNQVSDNDISGYQMSKFCVAGSPQIKKIDNKVERNRCGE
jgi:hypothetical protein